MANQEIKVGDIVTWNLNGKVPVENMIVLKVGKRVLIGYTPETESFSYMKGTTHRVPAHNLTKAA